MITQGWLFREADRLRDGILRKIFTPTESGRRAIGALLAALRRDPRFLTRMSAIYNGLCKNFADSLLQEVRAAGGTGQDLAALTAGTVVHIIAQNFSRSAAAASAICERIRKGVSS